MIYKYSQLTKKALLTSITDPEFQNWFKGSVMQQDGVPIVLYHQTSKESEQSIWEQGFDLSKGKARLSDELMPDGIFLKYDDKDIGVGAVEAENIAQMPLYVKIVNPLYVNDREHLRSFLRQDNEYADLMEELELINQEGKQKHELLWSEAKLIPRGDVAEHERLSDELDSQLEQWDAAVVELATKARQLSTKVLKSKGYDGLIVRRDKGSFNRSVHTVVVFSPSQIRSAKENHEIPVKEN